MEKKSVQKYMSEASIASCAEKAKAVFPAFSSDEYVVFPGFCDVHVHFREPGFSYKETIATGCASAARGGYTAVCTMPNLNPVPDSVESLREQLAIIERDATIDVIPYGSITVGQKGETLADLDGMAPLTVGFSDDGHGVQDDDMMRRAMKKAKALGKVIVAHCEVNDLLHGGYIHDGAYAKRSGHRGICSASEYEQIARDIALIREIGCSYHVCHISTAESVELIRRAKADGLDITCETAPHYLILTDEDLQEDGRFKMNPPLRGEKDRAALVEGICDGTIDMIATDHAPHSAEEKSKGLEKSAFGVVGLETAFAAMYTCFVKTGKITIKRLVELMSENPRRRFGIPVGEDFTVWDLNAAFTV
ncbi:MAG: dihydroorotase, partial [Oscillospiraceae bacterium]|nr:dihydroorotase [Oscillospiraceae bacterium]